MQDGGARLGLGVRNDIQRRQDAGLRSDELEQAVRLEAEDFFLALAPGRFAGPSLLLHPGGRSAGLDLLPGLVGGVPSGSVGVNGGATAIATDLTHRVNLSA